MQLRWGYHLDALWRASQDQPSFYFYWCVSWLRLLASYLFIFILLSCVFRHPLGASAFFLPWNCLNGNFINPGGKSIPLTWTNVHLESECLWFMASRLPPPPFHESLLHPDAQAPRGTHNCQSVNPFIKLKPFYWCWIVNISPTPFLAVLPHWVCLSGYAPPTHTSTVLILVNFLIGRDGMVKVWSCTGNR